MRFISIFLLTFLLSCGDTSDPETSVAPTRLDIQRDIQFEASRGYGPSSWSNYLEEVVKAAIARVPLELNVTKGNAGTGWASIVTSTRKFCYQGNASNSNTNNGTRFVLVKEKSQLAEDCSLTLNDMVFNAELDLISGEQIQISVHGGGCSVARGTCLDTTVKGNIEIIE